MSVRNPMSVRVLACLVAVAVAGTAGADDPATTKQLQETVAKLEKRIADLEAKVAALEKLAKAEPGKSDDEYFKTHVGALLDSLLAGDAPGMRGKFTKKMELGIDNLFKEGRLHDDEVAKWVANWNTMKYKTYTIDKMVFSPNKEEVVITGTMAGKDTADKAAFTLTLVKDKSDASKYLVDAIAVKAK